MTLPNGSLRKLIPQKRKDRYILEFMQTRIPGTYKLSDSERIVAKFVVLPSVSESILEKASEEKISTAALALADEIVRIDGTEGKGWDSYLTMDSRRKFGRETWQILLATVLALFFVEMILLKRFGRVAR